MRVFTVLVMTLILNHALTHVDLKVVRTTVNRINH